MVVDHDLASQAAGTVGELPGRADQLLQAIDNNKGLLGDLTNVLFGSRSLGSLDKGQ